MAGMNVACDTHLGEDLHGAVHGGFVNPRLIALGACRQLRGVDCATMLKQRPQHRQSRQRDPTSMSTQSLGSLLRHPITLVECIRDFRLHPATVPLRRSSREGRDGQLAKTSQ